MKNGKKGSAMILTSALMLSMTSPTFSAFNGLSIHSRANCVNNESISWDWTAYHQLWTGSDHFYDNKFQHNVSTDNTVTWRSAAVHWKEAYPTQSHWRVIGVHWIPDSRGKLYRVLTEVTNCSIYNGWWDVNKLTTIKMVEPKNIKLDYNKSDDLRETGLKIVPHSEMYNSEPIQKFNKEGYIETEDNSAQLMLDVKNRVPEANLKHVSDPFGFFLKTYISEIPTTFSYNEPKIPMKKLGYAGIMTNIGKSWTGVREFFENEKGDICSLQTVNIQDSKMLIKWDESKVTHDVNNYPTMKNVSGNKKYGFMYEISWVNNNYLYTLDCSNKTFEKTKLDEMLSTAKNLYNAN